jgi:oligoendopeptidase F
MTSKRKTQVKQLPPRSRVRKEDCWDLSTLFSSDAAWAKEFAEWQAQIEGYAKYRRRLAEGPKVLAKCLQFDLDFERRAEQLGIYAFLKTTEDQTNSDYQAMVGRYQNVATRAGEAASFIRPELTSIPAAKMKTMLASKELAPYRLMLERVLRYKKHTLSNKEEALLAMQGEMAQAADHAFRQLLDADMKFGVVTDEKGQRMELSNANFGQLLRSPKRSVRKAAFHKYYEQFRGHENTLTATLNGSIQKDIYYARARKYESALGGALFGDNVPPSVYDNLIASVRRHLPAQHRYYDLRRRKMRLKDIHHYDTYVPILSDLEKRHTWKQATQLVVRALEPLGDEYCATLQRGLTSARWCDRYPNRGKQSGAFSCGSFDGAPYILMNYKPEVLDDVFTLAHEAGHSMHSHYSSGHQPFQYYNYVIFVAEVASTFNEQLVSRYLMDRAADDGERAYLVNRELDNIRSTVIRQTMFAEFEKTTHAMAEAGEPLTVKAFCKVYRELLDAYFGPDFSIDEELELECLRIPHFYRAFYVYKYATGLSAAIALSDRVLGGGQPELESYLGFLKGGCSKWPLDLLRDAGVDMSSPEPVDTALKHFERLVDELDELL